MHFERESPAKRERRLALWNRQDRQLRSGKPPRLDDGLRLIRVFPEWDVDELPLWESFTEHYRVERGMFPISEELLDAFTAWNREGLTSAEAEEFPDHTRWFAEGRALVAKLRTELWGIAEIRAEFEFFD